MRTPSFKYDSQKTQPHSVEWSVRHMINVQLELYVATRSAAHHLATHTHPWGCLTPLILHFNCHIPSFRLASSNHPQGLRYILTPGNFGPTLSSPQDGANQNHYVSGLWVAIGPFMLLKIGPIVLGWPHFPLSTFFTCCCVCTLRTLQPGQGTWNLVCELILCM